MTGYAEAIAPSTLLLRWRKTTHLQPFATFFQQPESRHFLKPACRAIASGHDLRRLSRVCCRSEPQSGGAGFPSLGSVTCVSNTR